MSIRMRLPATHEIRSSHFPVLSQPQESGNAQAHYNMVVLEWRLWYCFKFHGTTLAFGLQEGHGQLLIWYCFKFHGTTLAVILSEAKNPLVARRDSSLRSE